ncbi:MAG: ABC transporter permease [Clostridiales bacterium]|nr:ABC transporter permease [Clostridiales bacterium]
MGQLWEYVKMALSNIRMNRGRSFLTMLGIIIGVSSVILIMSIGNGAKAEMEDELTSIAGGQIYIYANSNLEETQTITAEDREALRKLEHVKGVSTTTSMFCMVKTGKGSFETIVEYSEPDYEYATNPTMLYGQWYTWDDYNARRDVAVIGEADAIRMFGTADVVGLTFEMDDGSGIKDVRIIGVTKALDTTFVSTGYGSYLSASMPLSSDPYWAEYNDFDYVYIFGENGYSGEIADNAISLLESRHEVFGEDAFLTEDFDSQMASVMQVLDMITIFIMLVAAISLLVGGIGVMNIMLVSVTERTREIGIRKALGARTKSILVQFLAESAIITGIGGIIGIILGVAGAYGICSLPIVGFPPAISAATVIGATVFSCSVGIFFGIYPAKKAAHLSPIEALRRN